MSKSFRIFAAELNYARKMKKYLNAMLLCLALLSAGNIWGAKPVVTDASADAAQADEVLEVSEKMPQFPGGQSGLYRYLSENVRYPYYAEQKRIQGKVIVQFVVDKDGSVTDVKIEKSVHKSLDKEAVRVVKKMPKWIPGEQDGKPVRVLYHMPVNFSLH